MAETEQTPATQQFAEPKRLMGEVGTSGLRRYAGMVDEEFDPKLKGRRGVQVFETMRRNDPDVGAILLAIKQSLMSIDWTVERGGDSPADEEAAEFLESCMHDMSHSWKDMISDACTMFPFGWAYLEEVYKLRQGPAPGGDKPASEYNDGRIGWRKIVLRGQQSLDRWEFDQNGGIKGMWQRPQNGQPILIPIEKALLFRTDKENNNPEGISLLRNAYRPWFLKSTLEEVEAIGVERDLTGMPVIKLPMGASDEDMTTALNIIAKIKNDDQSGVVLPRTGEGEHQAWGFELIQSPGAGKIDTDKLYSRYSIAIARSVLAQFLTLGQGRVGSFALSRDMRDLFHLVLKGYLDLMAETINAFAVKRLFRLNDFKVEKLPTLVPGRMGQRDITILVDAVSKLVTMGMPMMPEDWNFIRQEMEMPTIPDEKLEEIEAEKEAQREAMLAGLAAGPQDDPDQGGSAPPRPTRGPQRPGGDERDEQQSPEGRAEQRRQTSEAYRYLFDMSEEEENETIRRNRKTPAALNRHRYRAAMWLNSAGEPRCVICGDEEPQNGYCAGFRGAEENGPFDFHAVHDQKSHGRWSSKSPLHKAKPGAKDEGGAGGGGGGSGEGEASPADADAEGDDFSGPTIRADQVDAFLKGSVNTEVSVHMTSKANAAKLQQGVDIDKTQVALFGQGFYTATGGRHKSGGNPEYGNTPVKVAIRMKNPYIDRDHGQTLVEMRNKLGGSNIKEKSANMKQALIDQGFDGILIEFPMDTRTETWAIALTNSSVKVVV